MNIRVNIFFYKILFLNRGFLVVNLISSFVNSDDPFKAAANGARVVPAIVVVTVVFVMTSFCNKVETVVTALVVTAVVVTTEVVVASTTILFMLFVIADFDQSATRAPAPIKIDGITKIIQPAGAT